MRTLTPKAKIFLTASVILPFLGYSIWYYSGIIKNAPYRFVDFDHIRFEYGPGDSLVNKYYSKTGEYQYVNDKDSIVKMHLKLTHADLMYLHQKAYKLGFWDFPTKELGDTTKTTNGQHPLHYIIEFGYKHKTKRVEYYQNFNGDPRLKEANDILIKEIQQRLNDAENMQK